MKLRYSPSSPFVRKVMATAIETGTAGRIEKVPTKTADADLVNDNPLGKVPALITDEGEKLYDSRVICEYLDSLHDGPALFPPPGPARWTALRRQALADGIMDAVVACFVEARRTQNEESRAVTEKQTGKVRRAVARLESEADNLGGPLTIGHVAMGCALAYIGRRLPDLDWRPDAPRLAPWYDDFATRPSMTETEPPD
jgi:glutathione S-transferase